MAVQIIISPMNYYIWTSGCQMNVADSQRTASSLEKLGYEPVEKAEEADVIVLNTCVVRQSAENRALGRLYSLRKLKEHKPELVISLMGCLVGNRDNAPLREKLPFVDVFSPPSDPTPLLQHLQARLGREVFQQETLNQNAYLDGELPLPLQEAGTTFSAHVPVVYGCSFACTYCIIPYRRGAEQSRPMADILSETESLVSQGVREITLLGQIVDRYGRDLPGNPDLPVLLRELHEIQGLDRIRFLTSHPNWMTAELIETVAELPRVCEHIEVPVQAGDDVVLERMKRGYTAGEYRRLVHQLRERIDGVSIATDVIVGFPGETREQFMHTFHLLEELRLDVAHLARYSPRPGTVADRRYPDDVSDEEKLERFRMLEALQEGISADIHRQHLGSTVELLIEEQHRGQWKGRTRTNKLVFINSQEQLLGRIVNARIIWAGPWSMRAELV